MHVVGQDDPGVDGEGTGGAGLGNGGAEGGDFAGQGIGAAPVEGDRDENGGSGAVGAQVVGHGSRVGGNWLTKRCMARDECAPYGGAACGAALPWRGA